MDNCAGSFKAEVSLSEEGMSTDLASRLGLLLSEEDVERLTSDNLISDEVRKLIEALGNRLPEVVALGLRTQRAGDPTALLNAVASFLEYLETTGDACLAILNSFRGSSSCLGSVVETFSFAELLLVRQMIKRSASDDGLAYLQDLTKLISTTLKLSLPEPSLSTSGGADGDNNVEAGEQDPATEQADVLQDSLSHLSNQDSGITDRQVSLDTSAATSQETAVKPPTENNPSEESLQKQFEEATQNLQTSPFVKRDVLPYQRPVIPRLPVETLPGCFQCGPTKDQPYHSAETEAAVVTPVIVEVDVSRPGGTTTTTTTTTERTAYQQGTPPPTPETGVVTPRRTLAPPNTMASCSMSFNVSRSPSPPLMACTTTGVVHSQMSPIHATMSLSSGDDVTTTFADEHARRGAGWWPTSQTPCHPAWASTGLAGSAGLWASGHHRFPCVRPTVAQQRTAHPPTSCVAQQAAFFQHPPSSHSQYYTSSYPCSPLPRASVVTGIDPARHKGTGFRRNAMRYTSAKDSMRQRRPEQDTTLVGWQPLREIQKTFHLC